MNKSKIIGEYFDGVYYDIIETHTDKTVKYTLKFRDGQTDNTGNKIIAGGDIPESADFTWERAVIILSNPWDRVRHYKDEIGEHYRCIVYDFIWIDLWASTIEELFNIIASLIYPREDDMDILLENIKKKEESTL